MEVVVCIDSDGRFNVIDLLNRKEIWSIINEYKDWDYENASSEEWFDFVENFVEKGRLEIVNLKVRKMKLNPDKEYLEMMRNSIKERNGYCPCIPKYLDSDDTKCPCKEFRENKYCHCKLYVEDNK